MAAFDHYSVAVFIHILGALAFFAALAVEWFSVSVLRRGDATGQPEPFAQPMSVTRRIGLMAMAMLLVSGTLMVVSRWNMLAWPAVVVLGVPATFVDEQQVELGRIHQPGSRRRLRPPKDPHAKQPVLSNSSTTSRKTAHTCGDLGPHGRQLESTASE